MKRTVNCAYCGIEIERIGHSHTGRFKCFDCKMKMQKSRDQRKKKGLPAQTVEEWWDDIHNKDIGKVNSK